MPAGVRQVPQFRGWPAADGAVFGESADIDEIVLALTGSRRERDRMDIVSLFVDRQVQCPIMDGK